MSALALSAQLHMPPLHDAFFAAAEERGFPVLEVPLAVPFIAVAQEVAASVQEDARYRLGAQLQVFGSLRWLVAEDLDTPALLRRLEALSGYDVYLCTPPGRPLLPGVPTRTRVCSPRPSTPRPRCPAVSSCRCPRPAARRASSWRTSVRAPSPRGSPSSSTSPRWRRCGWRWSVTSVRCCAVRARRHWPSCCRRYSIRRRPAAGFARHAIEGDAVLLVVRRTTDEALLHCLEGHPHLLLTWGEDRYVLGAPDLAEAVGDL